jgi:hypothetical protein
MKSKLIFLTFPFAVLFLLSGCISPYGGTLRFRGPGGLEQFSKEFHQCVAESRASGTPLPICGELRLCMVAKGYYQDPNGHIDATPVAVRCEP